MSADKSHNPFEDRINAIIDQYRALVKKFLDFGHLPGAFNDLIKAATNIRDLSSLTDALNTFRNSFFKMDLTGAPPQVIQNLIKTATGGEAFQKLPELVKNLTATAKKLSDRNAQMMYSVLGNVIIPINSALATLESMGLPVAAVVKSVKGITEKADILTPALEMMRSSLERFLGEAEKYLKTATGVELQQSEQFIELIKEFQTVVANIMDIFKRIGEK